MFVRIANEPRDYAWGSERAIADYLGGAAIGKPQAELWLGAHPAHPSVTGSGERLDTWLDAKGLPQPRMLLKVLAAAHPLSLQVHPTTEQAVEGYRRENAAGIPLDAKHRNYKDPNAKPEIIVAVSEFRALCGLRSPASALAVLDAATALDSRIAPFRDRVRDGLLDAISWMLGAAEASEIAAALAAIGRGLAQDFPDEASLIALLDAEYPGDAGIGVALLLNQVWLQPGEALFLPAGNMHAYLHGLGIELMGASDNVLRCGLTPKHIDAVELLRIADPASIDRPRLPASRLQGASEYAPDAPFALQHVTATHALADVSAAIVLAAADAHVVIDETPVSLARGEALYIADAAAVSVESASTWVALQRDTP